MLGRKAVLGNSEVYELSLNRGVWRNMGREDFADTLL